METWFVADTHFDHEAMLRHNNRPFENLALMNHGMVTDWNRRVGRKDRVYIVGDFAFARHGRWIHMLNGHKILIVGNHDKMPEKHRRLFSECYGGEGGAQGLLFRKICGQEMMLCHYPMMSWNKSSYGVWCICGHSHGRMSETLPGANYQGGLILDVGVDVRRKYYPMHFEEVKKEMVAKIQVAQ
jgi:calcineurin-like phosphoesterase family protein